MRFSNEETKFNIKLIVPIVLLSIALIAGVVFGVQAFQRKRSQDQYEQLAADTNPSQAKDDTQGEPKPSAAQPSAPTQENPYQYLIDRGVPVPEKEVDFAKLKAETNEDIYAWVYIPDTKVDYPVVQHPTDNTYYLNYNLDGSKGYPGCIYTEDYNEKDFSDPHTVLYGHNMKDGSMFAGLHKFEDEVFFEEHPYIYIYTEEGMLVYEIFSARETGDEHLLLSYDFDNARTFQGYLNDIFNTRSLRCNNKEDVEVTWEDRIITLSTCISNKPNNRYLVQGVLLNED